MKDEQDIIITLGKMNNRYERFNLVDDSFTKCERKAPKFIYGDIS
ncbi:hypothetical protein [Megamonas rupellensis]|jgi:hypothetical protein|nr:hypothetical protein [Megamonas rupellensis]